MPDWLFNLLGIGCVGILVALFFGFLWLCNDITRDFNHMHEIGQRWLYKTVWDETPEDDPLKIAGRQVMDDLMKEFPEDKP